MVLYTFRGTFKGMFKDIAPTGNKVSLPIVGTYRFSDGKIVETWGLGSAWKVWLSLWSKGVGQTGPGDLYLVVFVAIDKWVLPSQVDQEGFVHPRDESLKEAINNNKFKAYDDNNALQQVAAMPYSDSIKPEAICIVKPSQVSINILKQYIDTKTVNTVQSIYTQAKPQRIGVGLYNPETIDIADLDRKINNKTFPDSDLCVVASANSGFPGCLVNPIATRPLKNEGLTKIIFGDLTEYQGSIDIGNGQSIPALLNDTGNRVFVTVSGNEPYAQTLMNNIKRQQNLKV